MKFIEWCTGDFAFPLPWWMYHRLANAGRLQIGRLILMWPLPWHPAVRDLPGYGRDRPSGVRAALGLKQRYERHTSEPHH